MFFFCVIHFVAENKWVNHSKTVTLNFQGHCLNIKYLGRKFCVLSNIFSTKLVYFEMYVKIEWISVFHYEPVQKWLTQLPEK